MVVIPLRRPFEQGRAALTDRVFETQCLQYSIARLAQDSECRFKFPNRFAIDLRLTPVERGELAGAASIAAAIFEPVVCVTKQPSRLLVPLLTVSPLPRPFS
jgi:hypothetical protein